MLQLKLARHFGVVLAAAAAILPALCLGLESPARADQTVSDQTGRMTAPAIAQIDDRNQRLANATGFVVAVVLDRGTRGESAIDASLTADKFAKGRYGAVVWLATDMEQSDILYAGPARKWIPFDQQTALRDELAATIQYCCPSHTLPAMVDKIASAMESGFKVPPDPRNYVFDKLGLLDNVQVSNIVARDKQLEAATGKGVAVVLFPAQGGTPPSTVAFSVAASLNVSGEIAAVVWAAQSGGSLNFNMLRSPDDANLIADSSADTINSRFQEDMQTGRLGDAVVAAVDRTATSLESTGTPRPPSAQGVVSPIPGNPALQGSASASGSPANATPAVAQTQAPAPGGPGVVTSLLLLTGFAIIIVIVTVVLRRRRGY